MPPVISLPRQIAPTGPSNWLFQMTTFRVGTLTRRPSASRPDLMAMLSSPARSVLFLITTWSQHSGSQPSLFTPEWWVVTPLTVTCLHRVGCNCQKRELRRVTPWMSTVSQLYGCTNDERSLPAALRRWGGTPRATSGSRTPLRLPPWFQEAVPEVSRVPLPVSAMFFSPKA